MNIFQKVKRFFIRDKHSERRKPTLVERSMAAVVIREPLTYTRRQWKAIKHKRQISSRSRMINLTGN